MKSLKSLETKMINNGALPAAARITIDRLESMLAGNRHFTTGGPMRPHFKIDARGYVIELAATFETRLPDHGISGPKRFRIKWTDRMGKWRGSIK